MTPSGTTILVGIAASPGIAIGRCWSVDRRRVRTPKRRLGPDEVEAELARFRTSIDLSDLQLAEVKEKVEKADGSPGTAEHTAIIDMHRMMLKDEMLVLEAQRLIREDRVNAEWAVKRAVRKIKSAFHEHADEYFKERRADVDYVGERIIKNLLGQQVDVEEPPPEGAIIVAHDLSPADTALLLHERKVGAFVTDAGAKTSHTAIVARALEVPAVVAVGRITTLADKGDWVIVDGARGVVIINPTAGERADYEVARERFLEQERELLRTRDLPASTEDGVTVRLAGATTGEVFEAIVAGRGLTCEVMDDQLLITAPAKKRNAQRAQKYGIADLIDCKGRCLLPGSKSKASGNSPREFTVRHMEYAPVKIRRPGISQVKLRRQIRSYHKGLMTD